MLAKIKSKRYYILSFLITLSILLLVLFSLNFLFNVKYLFLKSDLDGQYITFLSYLRRFLVGEESLFYSFNKGLGGAMFGTFVYYLMTPINLIVLLFPKEQLHIAVIWIISLKIALSSLSMFTYLDHSYPKVAKYILLLLSLSYGLMAYNISYSFNIMWLDSIYLFPLLILGLDRLINHNKKILYYIVLLAIFLTNYYIGYMIALFTIIYIIVRLYLDQSDIKAKAKIFSSYAITSFFAGMSSMILLLPMIKELMISSKLQENIFAAIDFKFNFNIIDFFSKFYIASDINSGILNNYSILLYSGVFVIPLVILYFLNKKINLKEKLSASIVLFIFLISYLANYVNFVWHGFNLPLSFNARYSFIISFVMLILSLRSLIKSKYLISKDYLITGSLITAFSLLMLIINYTNLNIYMIATTFGLSSLYLIFLYFYHREDYSEKRGTIRAMVVLLVVAELFSNTYFTLQNHDFEYVREYTDFQKVMYEFVDDTTSLSDDFYRMERVNFDASANDGLLFKYNGIDNFISTNNQDSINFLMNHGCSYGQNSNFYFKPNYFIDSILGVKYMVSRDNKIKPYNLLSTREYSLLDYEYYDFVKTNVELYENPYALSLGYGVSGQVYDYHQRFFEAKAVMKYDLTNILANTITGFDDELFNGIEVTKIDDYTFEFVVPNDDPIYIYPMIKIKKVYNEIDYYVNGQVAGSISGRNNGIILLENFKVGSKIKFTVDESNDIKLVGNLTVAYLDMSVLKKYTDYLKTNEMDILELKGGYIKGEVILTADKPVLFTSIPYEPGWTAKVDGVNTNIDKTYDAFIALNIGEGKHTIELTYKTPYLNIGILISLISTVLFVLYIRNNDKLRNWLIDILFKYSEVVMYFIVGGLTTVISIGSYYILSQILGINYIIGTILSWIIAVLFAFFANKIVVFKSKKTDFLKEMIMFFYYRILSLIIDLGLMILFVSLLSIDDMIAKIIVQVVIVILNYYFSKKFIFKN